MAVTEASARFEISYTGSPSWIGQEGFKICDIGLDVGSVKYAISAEFITSVKENDVERQLCFKLIPINGYSRQCKKAKRIHLQHKAAEMMKLSAGVFAIYINRPDGNERGEQSAKRRNVSVEIKERPAFVEGALYRIQVSQTPSGQFEARVVQAEKMSQQARSV